MVGTFCEAYHHPQCRPKFINFPQSGFFGALNLELVSDKQF